MQIVVASFNEKKVRELKSILALLSDVKTEEIISAKEAGLDDIIEDGVTFEENALKKARAVFEKTGKAAVADDSGLIVEVLGNAPGILSARWAGVHGDDLKNNQLLLNQLQDLPASAKKAKFVCAFAVVSKLGEKVFVGEMNGSIIEEMRGKNGFGYDSIFVPDALLKTEYQGLTTAEVPSDVKEKISHRFSAIQKAVPELESVLQNV